MVVWQKDRQKDCLMDGRMGASVAQLSKRGPPTTEAMGSISVSNI